MLQQVLTDRWMDLYRRSWEMQSCYGVSMRSGLMDGENASSCYSRAQLGSAPSVSAAHAE